MSEVLGRVFWDAGHGGNDPGAVGNGLKEADLAIKVVKYACSYMKETYKCEVYQDITPDSLVTITSRANNWKADLFISVHFNAGGGDGYEALVYGSGNKKLGECFEKQVLAIGQNSRGVKYRPDLWVLKATDMPAILNECAFIDNKKDIQDWSEDKQLKKMGEALAKAAAEWLKLPKKTTDNSKEYKTLGNIKFRKTASTKSVQLGIVPKGTVLTGTVDSNGWLKTKYNGVTGYVRQKSKTKTYCGLIGKYKTLYKLNYRKNATTVGSSYGIVPKGTTLTGAVNDNGWLLTKYNGKVCWVRQKSKKKTYCQKV